MPSPMNDNLFNGSTNSGTGKQRRRWQLAFATIYCSRVILSLAKNSVRKQLTCKHSRSASYTAIDVTPETGYFGIDQASLSEFMWEGNVQKLSSYGGVQGIAARLRSDVKGGITNDLDELLARKKIFGTNMYEKPPVNSLFHFVFKAFKDPMILFLLLYAAVSLGFGVGKHGLIGWKDGGSILIAVSVVIAVSSVSNFWPSRQFNKLSKSSDNVKAKVVRSRRPQKIPISQIVVGDIVYVCIGDEVPADGLLLDSPLEVDESSLTGNTDKVEVNCTRNPFLHTGSVVIEGHARMLVTSVGKNTTWGKILSTIWQDSKESTPLQTQLQKITSLISIVGLTVASLVFVVWLVRYFTDKMENGYVSGVMGFDDVVKDVLGILATAIAIAAGAVADGLPLAVAITRAYSMKSMMNNRALVRRLSACEAIASVTTICTRLNQMTVTKFWLGQEFIEQGISSAVAPRIIQLLHQGIGLNTTQPPSKASSFFWTPTEKAIMHWAIHEMGMDIKDLKESCSILHGQPSDSVKTCGGFLMRKNDDNTIHLHWKGTSEAIMPMCSAYYDIKGNCIGIDVNSKTKIEQIISSMAANGLRCIVFAHKEVLGDPCEYDKSHQVLDKNCLTLLAIIGVKDPCQSGIVKAVQDCQNGGMHVKMITRDGSSIAKATARDCGILTTHPHMDSEVVKGTDFKNYTEEERMQKVNRIQVMTETSPFDMLMMVRCLKNKGDVVAVISNETIDAAALREADVGISMGNQVANVAKESSDIILLDEHCGCIFNVLKWGRSMFNHVQIFTQFQITFSITSLVIDSVTAISARKPPNFKIAAAISSGEVPFAALQVLWVKLIMGTLAALALAVGQSSKELMMRPVDQKTLITNIMWRNISTQTIYHITALLMLHFKGKAILGVNGNVKDTLIFNTLVLCQIFNKFNARVFEEKNIFKNIHKSKFFLGIIGVVIVLQAVMVEFLTRYGRTEQLSWSQWGISIAIAAASWPIAWFAKLIPVPKKPFLSYLN